MKDSIREILRGYKQSNANAYMNGDSSLSKKFSSFFVSAVRSLILVVFFTVLILTVFLREDF
jgi:hypothetical protein